GDGGALDLGRRRGNQGDAFSETNRKIRHDPHQFFYAENFFLINLRNGREHAHEEGRLHLLRKIRGQGPELLRFTSHPYLIGGDGIQIFHPLSTDLTSELSCTHATG